jgi:ubiquinone/menaquinone biosynthesis C-methylase UbiE
MKKESENIYKKRFNEKELIKKNKVWRILTIFYFQKFINPKEDIILDIGAGYCEFLNNIHARKKIAFDINEDIKNYAEKDVKVIIGDCKDMKQISDKSIDKIFVSNFFEHLKGVEDILKVLGECHRILKENGRIIILQPNIYYIGEAYWFFIDHKIPLTHKSMAEALNLSGFKILLLKKRFLPYTTKSFLSQFTYLIRIYLRLPFLQNIFGKQMLVIAKK